MSNKSFSTTTEEKLSGFQSIMAGSLSGLFVRFVIAPIDIVKIRLQLQPDSVRYSGILSTVRTIYTNEGARAFWKGNFPAAVMYILYGGSQFWAYSNLSSVWDTFAPKQYINNNSLKNTTVGFTAGMFATLISYPFDLLRTNLASNDSKKFNSLFGEIKSIWNKRGPRGFFGGCFVSMVYVGSMTGLSFGVYSTLMNLGESERLGNKLSISSVAGVFAGTFSKTMVYPLDLAKRHLQIIKAGKVDSIVGNTNRNISTSIILKQVIAKSGVKGLYRGLLPSLLKSVPATATSLWCFELFSSCFRSYNKKMKLN